MCGSDVVYDQGVRVSVLSHLPASFSEADVSITKLLRLDACIASQFADVMQ